jgi:hypothetical protein
MQSNTEPQVIYVAEKDQNNFLGLDQLLVVGIFTWVPFEMVIPQ